MMARREPEAEGLEARTEDAAVAVERSSGDLIYDAIMRGGGEPFGDPMAVGVGSLTEKIVLFFKQRSFFGFETWEKRRPKNRTNKFTRYGASRYFGQLRKRRPKP